MEKLLNWNKQRSKLLTLVLIICVLSGSLAGITQAQSSSAASSQPSATPVDDSALRRACAEAIEELRAARKLIAAQDAELKISGELIALEKQISDGLKNLRTLDESQRKALMDAIAAKDRVIAAYEAEIAVLKKKNSFWSKAKWFLIGGAVGAVAGVVIANE